MEPTTLPIVILSFGKLCTDSGFRDTNIPRLDNLAKTEIERKEYNRLRQQKLVASYSPERLEDYREKCRLYQAERRAARTPEQYKSSLETHKEWFKKNKDNPSFRERKLRQSKEFYQNNHARLRAVDIQKTTAARQEVIDLLGGKCSTCSFSDIRALEIDHIQGDGYLEKATGTITRYRKLVNTPNLVERFQLLCGNCHNIKTHDRGEHRRAASRPTPLVIKATPQQ